MHKVKRVGVEFTRLEVICVYAQVNGGAMGKCFSITFFVYYKNYIVKSLGWCIVVVSYAFMYVYVELHKNVERILP